MSLNKAIIKIRVDLQNMGLRQSGKNKFAGFSYFELADFLPSLNSLMLENDMNDRYYVTETMACLDLIKGEEVQTYTIPYTQFMTPTNKNGQPSMQDIQYLGALNTYYKRYLYLNAFGITDGEIVDSMDNSVMSKTISQIQAKSLTDYAKDMGVDIKSIPQVQAVSRLGEMTVDDYQKAMQYAKDHKAK